MIVYLNGRFISKEEATISPDDRGFLFADGVYEVIHSYKGRLFRAEDHLDRMKRSLRELRIKAPDMASFKEISEKLIQDNTLRNGDANVYIQITRGAAFIRKHAFPPEETPLTIYACASPVEPPHEKWEKGSSIILTPDIRWARCDIKSVALLANVMACQQAKENGADEAVFVRDGVITEGSHTNFSAIFDGQLVTAPKSNYILPGVTRKVVLDLCPELGIPVKEFPIFEADLKHADECMLLGTTAEVMPVVQVDGWQVGNGSPGEVTMKLLRAFRELT